MALTAAKILQFREKAPRRATETFYHDVTTVNAGQVEKTEDNNQAGAGGAIARCRLARHKTPPSRHSSQPTPCNSARKLHSTLRHHVTLM